MDSVNFYKLAQVEELIVAISCSLTYLPLYSSDCNFIEHIEVNLRRYIRKYESF